jgi:hypothetical protein
MPASRSHRLKQLALALLLLAAPAGCGKSTQLEAGAVMLDLSVAAGVTTPDELRVWVYDDTGALWKDIRVPGTGALRPESATHLGTVLVQPGTATGALRVQVRGLAAAARVADGMLTIPAGSRGTFALRLDADEPADGDGDGVPDSIDDCPGLSNADQGGCPGAVDAGDDSGSDAGIDSGGDAGTPSDGDGVNEINCNASDACNHPNGATCRTACSVTRPTVSMASAARTRASARVARATSRTWTACARPTRREAILRSSARAV